MDEEEIREKILENMTTEGDFKNQVDYARKEGRAEGLAEAQMEIARKFKALGVEISTIVGATGLDRETVESL